jgi:hypothetical protein
MVTCVGCVYMLVLYGFVLQRGRLENIFSWYTYSQFDLVAGTLFNTASSAAPQIPSYRAVSEDAGIAIQGYCNVNFGSQRFGYRSHSQTRQDLILRTIRTS